MVAGVGMLCPLHYTAGSFRVSEAGGTGPRMGESGSRHPSGPPLPLSPCRAVPYSRRSTLEKIDCLFLPDCSRVTGCRGGRRRGDEGGRLPPHQDGFFCFSACRKSRNRIREAAQGVITVPARACQGPAL